MLLCLHHRRCCRLRLGLKPVGTGIYPARVLLTSASGLDVRVLDVELTAQTLTQVRLFMSFVVFWRWWRVWLCQGSLALRLRS